ncbi:MAG: AraC family transcriptional regulator [Paracoccaceae bacterium]|nr:AraC family transcriptional regulator [Paracoccaceae bacterium]
MKTRLFTIDAYLRPGAHFHFARKTLDDAGPRFAHYHDFFEVLLVETGALDHWINGRWERLSRGALLFVRPADTHALSAVAGSRARIVNIVVRPDTVDHLGARYGADLGQRFFWSTARLPDARQLDGPRIERAVNTAMDLQTDDRSLARIEQFLLALMTRVVDISVDPTSAAPDWLATACLAARDPQVFRRGAAGLVEASRRGHEHVCRAAKRHLGMSPTDYVNRIRMEHAAMLLGDGRMSIEEVAGDCGLANLSYFYRLFRAHYGTTPREYRRRHAVETQAV